MEHGKEWVAKHERTVYRPLASQAAIDQDVELIELPVPPDEEVAEFDRIRAEAAAKRRVLELVGQWAADLQLAAEAGGPAVGLVDVRPVPDFAAGALFGGVRARFLGAAQDQLTAGAPWRRAGHVAGATSLPWGAGGELLVARAHELPPRGATLAVFASGLSELQAATSHLTKSGYPVLWGVAVGREFVGNPAKKWEVGVAGAGVTGGWGVEVGSRRLWNVSPCLQLVMPVIEELMMQERAGLEQTAQLDAGPMVWGRPAENRAATPTHGVGVAVDLGCGSGRDCVWLAGKGWRSAPTHTGHCPAAPTPRAACCPYIAAVSTGHRAGL